MVPHKGVLLINEISSCNYSNKSSPEKMSRSSGPDLDTKYWKTCIAMLVGSTPDDSDHIDTMVHAIKLECDKNDEPYPFSYISRDVLYSQVMKVKLGCGASGNLPDGNYGSFSSAFQEICKMCKLYHVLPPWILAQLVRIRLLAIRETKLNLREAANQSLRGRFSRMLQLGFDKFHKAMGFQYDSCEDRDDEKVDPLYIIMSGFHDDPRLLTFLAEIGITVDCIIRIETKLMSNEQSQKTETAGTNNAAAEANKEETKKLASELETFWQDVQPILDDDLRDVARFRCFVGSIPLLQDEPDTDSAALVDMFDDISLLLANLLEAKRQWKSYVELSGNILPIDLAVPDPTIISDGAGCSVSCHMSPSSASLLDSTAQSVAPDLETKTDGSAEACAVEDGQSQQSEAVPSLRTEEPDDSVRNHLSAIAFKLALSAEQETELHCEFTPPLPHIVACTRKQLLISYHDDVTRKLNDRRSVDGFDRTKDKLESLGYTCLDSSAVGDTGNSSRKIIAEHATRFMKLLSHCSCQSEDAEITDALQHYVFESIDLSKMDEFCRQVDALLGCVASVGTVPVATEEDKLKEGRTEQEDKAEDKPVTPGNSVNSDVIMVDGAGNKLVYAHPAPSDEKQQQPITQHDAGFELLFCNNRQQPIPSDSGTTMPEAVVNSTTATEKQFPDVNLVELMKPLQILLKALQTHAAVDVYCDRLDQSVLIVLRTPDGASAFGRNGRLPSNPRFRDCLEQGAATGDKWLQQTDVRRRTDWLDAEVRRLRKEKRDKAEEDEKLAQSKATQEETHATNPGSVPPSTNSLTVQSTKIGAWNEELERIKLEVKEDEEKLAVRAKRLEQMKLEMKQEEEMVAALANDNKLAWTGNRLTRRKCRRRSMLVPDSETADHRTIGDKLKAFFTLCVTWFVFVLAAIVFTRQAAPSQPNTVETRDFSLSEETDPSSPLSTLEQESMPESLRVEIIVSHSDDSISSSPSPPLEQLPVEPVHTEELPESESPSTLATWCKYLRNLVIRS